MGDQGRLYVNENVVPVYKNLLRDADLILPNQFEAEYVSTALILPAARPALTALRLLSGTEIACTSSLRNAVSRLHRTHQTPHVMITSVRLPSSPDTMSVVGSTCTSDYNPRLFIIDVPAIDCFFSGTGDMFAALMVVRLREAVAASGLSKTKSWVSRDEVAATDLPLAQAAEKVLGSMHAVLTKTKNARDQELEAMKGLLEREDSDKRLWLRKTKAAEVKVVRCLNDLKSPVVKYRAAEVE